MIGEDVTLEGWLRLLTQREEEDRVGQHFPSLQTSMQPLQEATQPDCWLHRAPVRKPALESFRLLGESSVALTSLPLSRSISNDSGTTLCLGACSVSCPAEPPPPEGAPSLANGTFQKAGPASYSLWEDGIPALWVGS